MRCSIRPIVKRASAPATASSPASPWLRVLTYNVLAQSLIRRNFYPTSGNAIKWGQRMPALTEEIKAYKPDILFLQEFDNGKSSEWDALFTELNMDSRKFGHPSKSHGLVIAWTRDLFQEVENSVVHLDYDVVNEVPSQASTGNVGLALVLQKVDSEDKFVVGTTHLYWHPGADYERMRQLCILTKALFDLCKEYNQAKVIVGADMNSTPDSPAYQFWNRGLKFDKSMLSDLMKSAEHPVFAKMGADPLTSPKTMLADPAAALDRLVKFAEHVAAQNTGLVLRSSYKEVLGAEPEFTNWTADFKETIDYIFISPDLSVSGVLQLPSKEDLGPEPNALPHARSGVGYPSDHLPLMAELY